VTFNVSSFLAMSGYLAIKQSSSAQTGASFDFLSKLCYYIYLQAYLKSGDIPPKTGEEARLVIMPRTPVYKVLTEYLFQEIVAGRLKEGYNGY
jgi:hypothetical protein